MLLVMLLLQLLPGLSFKLMLLIFQQLLLLLRLLVMLESFNVVAPVC